jgi:regulator of cell morphogenesis and NO signaling
MDNIDTATRPLDALCDDIVDRYHAPLRRRLLRIREALAVAAENGSGKPLESMRWVLADLAQHIDSHLSKEEYLLFPAIAALASAERDERPRPQSAFVTVLHPIRMLEAEHANIEEELERLRELAREASGPATTTPAWRHCMADLAELDEALREHHRTENEVLFPRALETEHGLFGLKYDEGRDRAR